MWRWLTQVVVVFVITSALGVTATECPCALSQEESQSAEKLWARLNAIEVEVCDCTLATVEQINFAVIVPALEGLLQSPFFEFFHTDLSGECPLWQAEGMCMIRECGIEVVEDDTALLRNEREAKKSTNEVNENETAGGVFVSLVKNPERFTGYVGSEPERIWNELHSNYALSIAQERCKTKLAGKTSVSGPNCAKAAVTATSVVAAQLLQRIVSGMHASISSHVTFDHLLNRTENRWGSDIDLYRKRVGDHPARIDNLVFVYLLVLTAIDKAADALVGYPKWTDNSIEDVRTLRLLDAFFEKRHLWPRLNSPYLKFLIQLEYNDNSERDSEDAVSKMLFRQILQASFRNMTRVLDCITCDRCRLWGNIQVMGLNTAVRIISTSNIVQTIRSLTRPEVVALMNTLGRFSHSIRILTTLRPLYSIST